MTGTPNGGTVSVSRELLERLSLPMQTTPSYLNDHRDALDELRFILAQPAEQQDEPYRQHKEIMGYARKADLEPLLDEAQPCGSHIYIGLDHPVCWADEPPYDHLVPLYLHPAAQAVKLPSYRQGLIDAQRECDRISGDHAGRTDRERKGAGECSAAIRAKLNGIKS